VTPAFIRSELNSACESIYERVATLHRPAQVTQPTNNNANHTTRGTRLYAWGGRFYRLPQGYHLPKVGAHIIWQHWWFGDDTQGIPPLKMVQGSDLTDSKRLSDLKFLMKTIEKCLSENASLIEMPTINQVNQMYDKAAGLLQVSSMADRSGQVVWTTIVRKLRVKEKRRREEEEEEEGQSYYEDAE